jgi:hypothetical protein
MIMRRIKGVRIGRYEAPTHLLSVDDELYCSILDQKGRVDVSRKFYIFTIRLHAWK